MKLTNCDTFAYEMRQTGFEPATFGSGGQRSIQLSYWRATGGMVERQSVAWHLPPYRHTIVPPCEIGAAGLEPATSCSRSRRATGLRYAPLRTLGP